VVKLHLYTNINWEGKYSYCEACIRPRYESLSYSHYLVDMAHVKTLQRLNKN